MIPLLLLLLITIILVVVVIAVVVVVVVVVFVAEVVRPICISIAQGMRPFLFVNRRTRPSLGSQIGLFQPQGAVCAHHHDLPARVVSTLYFAAGWGVGGGGLFGEMTDFFREKKKERKMSGLRRERERKGERERERVGQ